MLGSLGNFLPEIVLFFGAMIVLLLGAFGAGASLLLRVSAGLLLASAGLVLWQSGNVSLDGQFAFDAFAQLFKSACFFACAVSLLMAEDYLRRRESLVFEFPVLVLLAALGMGIMISASDLLAMYLGLELQSLALYVLATMERDSAKGSEAGVKYFVLGALASGLLLYGASWLYGASGYLEFALLGQALANDPQNLGMIVGVVFLLAGLAFKISAVPFHMWTPDVYQGVPTPVTAFFAVAPKLAAMALLARVLLVGLGEGAIIWQQLVIVLALASIVLGASAAIGQSSIKRLLAYSSIGNMGYALLALVAGSEAGVQAFIIYLLLYGAMTLSVFACLLALRDDDNQAGADSISSLAGLSRTHPFVAFCLAVLMFSLAGIPPLAGFFGKYFVFASLVADGFIILAVLGIVGSVIAAVYYLKIVKVLYVDESHSSYRTASPLLLGLSGLGALFALGFVVAPDMFSAFASQAAGALLQ